MSEYHPDLTDRNLHRWLEGGVLIDRFNDREREIAEDLGHTPQPFPAHRYGDREIADLAQQGVSFFYLAPQDRWYLAYQEPVSGRDLYFGIADERAEEWDNPLRSQSPEIPAYRQLFSLLHETTLAGPTGEPPGLPTFRDVLYLSRAYPEVVSGRELVVSDSASAGTVVTAKVFGRTPVLGLYEMHEPVHGQLC